MMKWGYTGQHDRIKAVYGAPLRAAERVDLGEWCRVLRGFVLVIWSPVLVVDGVARLDGVVMVGNGPGRAVWPVVLVRGVLFVSGVLVDSVPGVLSVGGLVGVAGVLGVRNV